MKHAGALCILSILLFCACRAQVPEQDHRPNILIIHVDDLGYHDLGFTGSTIYQTPHIDALAGASRFFEQAYANYPRCVPSRYAMMTGGYPVYKGTVPDDGFEMDKLDVDKNYIKHIKAQGYETAYFGKWHLGEGNASPVGVGYDYSYAAGAAGSPISYVYPFNEPKGKGQPKKNPIPDVDDDEKPGDYLTDLLTSKTIDYIKNRDDAKPFMVMLAFYAVHQPLEAKEEDIKRNIKQIKDYDFGAQPEYINEGTGRTKMRQDNPVYAGMVENMDENVGRILQMLEDKGLDKNTVVILSSDHGGLSNDGTKQRHLATSNYPLRAGKGWLYEGGIKVPLMVRWPGKIKPGIDSENQVLLMDVFPTLMDLIMGKRLNTDGRSFLPTLLENKKLPPREVFWHSPNARPQNTGDTPSSAVRKGDFKLIHWFEEDRVELYNLVDDPYERQDLSKQMPKKVNELKKDLLNWKSTF